MMAAYRLRVGAHEVTVVRPHDPDSLGSALAQCGLRLGRPALVVVGGAGGLDAAMLARLAPVFANALVPALELAGAVAIDGGTDAGVMRLLGEARVRASAGFPLVGVVAEGTVRMPGGPFLHDTAELEPHHTHFVLVPGDKWGDEAVWIARTATRLAEGAPSVTMLINGGDIAFDDAARSLDAGRPIVVLAGSGRAADEIVAALRDEHADERARRIAASGRVISVPVNDPALVRKTVSAALGITASD